MTTARRLTTVVIATLCLVACSADDRSGDEADPPAETSAQGTSSPPPASGDAILIETRITDARAHTGEVLDGSVIGEAAFCTGGESAGASEGATITATFDCPGGTLTVEYAPRQNSAVQSSEWEVVSGTGEFVGLRGGGWMVAAFDSDDPDIGREVFAGTVSA